MSVVAGVDSSTQSCTVELRDAHSGLLLGTGRAPHPPTNPPISEHNVADWWTAFKAALAAAIQASGLSPATISAISIGAQCHGLVALDANGRQVRPVKLWNDTTAAPQVARLIAERPQASWVEEVLLPLNPALTIAKLAWVAENEPEHLERIAAVMVPHDWLTYRLTGERVTDRSDASGTGYFSAPQGRFRTDLLREHISDRVDWDSVLPRIAGPEESVGYVVPEVAAELGLADKVVVGPGGGDQHLAAVGIGLRPGEVAVSLGTSGVVFTPAELPAHRDWSVDFVCDVTGSYLPLICTLNCTKVTDRFAYFLGVDLATLDQMALAADQAPVLLPYLDGERTPMRPGASGVLADLRGNTTREGLAKAAYDGVVQGLFSGMETLQQLAGRSITDRVVALGGGARSLAYRQFFADRSGRPVVTVDAPEATARGACIQAAAVLHQKSVSEVRDAWAPPVRSEVAPRPGAARGVDPAYRTLSTQFDSWFFEAGSGAGSN